MVDLSTIPLFITPGPELVVILLIAILLFGANKIPKLARSTGQALGEFQKGKEQAEQELQEIKDETAPDVDGDLGSTSTTTDTTTEDSTTTETADAGPVTETETDEPDTDAA